jgi:hypothetical protein
VRILYETDMLLLWERNKDTLDVQVGIKDLVRFSAPLVELAEKIVSRLPHVFFGGHLRSESYWPAHINPNIGEDILKNVLKHNQRIITTHSLRGSWIRIEIQRVCNPSKGIRGDGCEQVGDCR